MENIKWNEQHCGVIHGEVGNVLWLMPDLEPIVKAFPEDPNDFIWDVKVHMLMKGMWPCIPGVHQDMVPRDKDGKEDFSKITPEIPMYLWVSGDPLTVFEQPDGSFKEIEPMKWVRFTQLDKHAGQVSTRFQWRGMLRACHKDLNITSPNVNNPFGDTSVLRRHSQVYLDANDFKW